MHDRVQVEDSLLMARQRFPGQRNSLDALCKRLGVDNNHRQLHGALLDAQLLCEVYLHLTAGQGEIGFGGDEPSQQAAALPVFASLPQGQRQPVRVSEAEAAAHEARLVVLRKKSGDKCLWDALSP
jgi:DNA polymerase-3 subunit epsilon